MLTVVGWEAQPCSPPLVDGSRADSRSDGGGGAGVWVGGVLPAPPQQRSFSSPLSRFFPRSSFSSSPLQPSLTSGVGHVCRGGGLGDITKHGSVLGAGPAGR